MRLILLVAVFACAFVVRQALGAAAHTSTHAEASAAAASMEGPPEYIAEASTDRKLLSSTSSLLPIEMQVAEPEGYKSWYTGKYTRRQHRQQEARLMGDATPLSKGFKWLEEVMSGDEDSKPDGAHHNHHHEDREHSSHSKGGRERQRHEYEEEEQQQKKLYNR